MAASTAGLLLMVVVSCPAVGQTPFAACAPQDVYQAQEHGNVTLTWMFAAGAYVSDSLTIDVVHMQPPRTVYSYNSKLDPNTYQNEFYRGRVLCDLDGATKGCVECLFVDRRLSDTGDVIDGYAASQVCGLNVAAASDRPVNETSKPAGWGSIRLYASLVALTLVASVS